MSDIEESTETENNFVVEAIVDKRVYDGEVQYLLKWKNFPPEENTWEPSTNLNCPALLDDFEKNHPNGSLNRPDIPAITTQTPNKAERKIKKPRREPLPDNLELDEIIGASDASGELFFLIKW
jgi:chromobox protein 1